MDFKENAAVARQRSAMIDNVRALLMTLVVVGHLLEMLPFAGSDYLSAAIYAFHMPAYAFVGGLCFKRGRNVFREAVFPYILFQVVFCIGSVLHPETSGALQFATPDRSLWYLVAYALWQMSASCLNLRGKWGVGALGVSLAAALLIGFDNSFGGYLALSRTICFFPFFLAGACIRENGFEKFEAFICGKCHLWKWVAVAVAVLCQLLLVLQHGKMRMEYFYCASGYGVGGSLGIRAMVFFMAAAMILAIFLVMPKKKLPLITYVGQHPMPVYLLERFTVKVLTNRVNVFALLPGSGAVWVAVLTVAIVLVYTSKPVVFLFNKFVRLEIFFPREKQKV